MSVGADRSDRRRNRSRRLQDRLAQLDIGQRPEHEGSSACPSVQFLLQDHTRSSRYKGDLNTRYLPATARRPISLYDARRPNSPLGRTLSIVVIGVREPCHKHAELRHDASNFVVLKSPLTAHPAVSRSAKKIWPYVSSRPAFLHQLARRRQVPPQKGTPNINAGVSGGPCRVPAIHPAQSFDAFTCWRNSTDPARGSSNQIGPEKLCLSWIS